MEGGRELRTREGDRRRMRDVKFTLSLGHNFVRLRDFFRLSPIHPPHPPPTRARLPQSRSAPIPRDGLATRKGYQTLVTWPLRKCGSRGEERRGHVGGLNGNLDQLL